jgi:hypothetical protein
MPRAPKSTFTDLAFAASRRSGMTSFMESDILILLLHYRRIDDALIIDLLDREAPRICEHMQLSNGYALRYRQTIDGRRFRPERNSADNSYCDENKTSFGRDDLLCRVTAADRCEKRAQPDGSRNSILSRGRPHDLQMNDPGFGHRSPPKAECLCWQRNVHICAHKLCRQSSSRCVT